MLELHVHCRNKVKVIDPHSALSTVFGSRNATFYINKREKISIIFKTGTLKYWKLIINNRGGLGGSHHLDVDLWPGNHNPTFTWDFFGSAGSAPPGLIVKSRPTFFGL